LTQLTYLDLAKTSAFSDASSCMAQLTRLAHLNLSDTRVDDISSLAQMTRLTRLDISHTFVEDMQPLSHLGLLRYLDAHYCRNNDFTPVGSCRQLDHLGLCGVKIGDRELDAMAGLQLLLYLDISSSARVSDLSPLSGLTLLEDLRMWDTRVVARQQPSGQGEEGGEGSEEEAADQSDKQHSDDDGPDPGEGLDISPLSCLTALTSLYLCFCRLRAPPGPTPLLGLSRLRTLRAEGVTLYREESGVVDMDSQQLNSLTGVEVLEFDYDNQISPTRF
jgi:Leucine-rich repeat (LRR) protein